MSAKEPKPENRSNEVRRRWVYPVAVMAIIFLNSSMSKVATPSGLPGFDKIAHFSVYGLLSVLLVRVWFSPDRAWRHALIALVATSLYGVSDEFHQSFTPGRSTELADWVADTLGAIVGLGVYCFWSGLRSWLERSIHRGGASRNAEAAAVAGAMAEPKA